jgi:pyruvate dehydrogenase E1 component
MFQAITTAPWEAWKPDAHIVTLLDQLPQKAGLITVLDGHPTTLSWLGSVTPQSVIPLGCDRFGQSGDIPDLYREYGLDVSAIIAAAGRLFCRK